MLEKLTRLRKTLQAKFIFEVINFQHLCLPKEGFPTKENEF